MIGASQLFYVAEILAKQNIIVKICIAYSNIPKRHVSQLTSGMNVCELIS